MAHSIGKKEEIEEIRYRLRDSDVMNEVVRLKTNTPHRSYIFLAYLPYGTIYTVETTRRMRDEAAFSAIIENNFPGATISKPKRARNVHGNYLYATADYGGDETCVYARQGWDVQFTPMQTEAKFDAIVDFRYCAEGKTTVQILELFDGLSFKN